MKRCFFCLMFVCVFVSCAVGETLGVTSVVIIKEALSKPARARIILGGVLVIENITVHSDGSIKLPHYKTKHKLEYPQIEFLDPTFEEEVIKAVIHNKETRLKGDYKIQVRIAPCEMLTGKSKRLCNVRVIFNDAVAVVCAVMQGRRGLWIAWPSSKDKKGVYRKHAYVLKKKLKKSIEKKIFDKYNKQKTDNRS